MRYGTLSVDLVVVSQRGLPGGHVSTTDSPTHSSSRINANITSVPHQTEHSRSLVTMSSQSNITVLNAHQRTRSGTSIDPNITGKANVWNKRLQLTDISNQTAKWNSG